MPVSRGHPSTDLQVTILEEQDNRCLYCGHKFGTLVTRGARVQVWLEVTWDHFIPFAYCGNNRDDNWVAACQLCNSYKSDLIFPGVLEIRDYIRDKAIANEHYPLPFWFTEETSSWSELEPFDHIRIELTRREAQLISQDAAALRMTVAEYIRYVLITGE